MTILSDRTETVRAVLDRMKAEDPGELEAQLNDMSEDDLASLLAEELEKESPYDHG